MSYWPAKLMKIFAVMTVVVLLCACVTHPAPTRTPDSPPTYMSLAKKSVSDTRRGIPDALRAPFRDFNLMKRSIPAVLQRITYPYAINGPVHCTALIIEINALNSVLGNSADVSALENSRPEQIAEAASNAATNAIEDAATGWIPYRSIIRRITGAHQYEREIRKAYERGRIRRAFLKGVGGAYGCAYPARPSSVKEPMRIIVPPESPIRPVDREPPPTRVLPEKYRQKR